MLDAAREIAGCDVYGSELLQAVVTVAPADPLAMLAAMLPTPDEFDEENQLFRIDAEAGTRAGAGKGAGREFLRS